MLYDSAMKYTVKNNSNAPHDLMTIKGRVVVLAGESVDVEFDAGSLGVYEFVPFFEVSPRGEKPNTVKIDISKSDAVKLTDGGTVIPAPSSENSDPVRRKPGRPKKAD